MKTGFFIKIELLTKTSFLKFEIVKKLFGEKTGFCQNKIFNKNIKTLNKIVNN